MTVILALSHSTKTRLEEVGLVIAAIGGLLVAVGGASGLAGLVNNQRRRQERIAYLIGGLLVAAGLLLQLAGVHF